MVLLAMAEHRTHRLSEGRIGAQATEGGGGGTHVPRGEEEAVLAECLLVASTAAGHDWDAVGHGLHH